MVPAVAASLAFLFLLNPFGPIDTILRFLHLPAPLWFQDPTWAKPGLVLLGFWGIGATMIIFLAALLDVPVHLYEAADIEGAGAWQKFRNITLPMISPVIFFSAVIGVIYGLQYFTEAFVISSGASGSGAGASSWGTRSSRRSSTRSGSTNRGSSRSTSASRRRWRGSCSSSSWRARWC